MDIIQTPFGNFVGSIATGFMPVTVPPFIKELRRHPEATIWNLLARAERAQRSGNLALAHQLTQKAEWAFKLVTDAA